MSNKYFNVTAGRTMDIKKDCLSMDEWKLGNCNTKYCISDGKCKIFIKEEFLKNEIDEYRKGDPYYVEETSEFHKRRIDITQYLIKEILKIENKELKVLDIGCGKGYITNKIKEIDQRLDVTGCDYSYLAIKDAIDKFGKRIDFDVVDINSLPYTRGWFDIIILNNIFEHIPNIVECMKREVASVLKPDGYVIISTPSRYRIQTIANVLRRKDMKFVSDLHVTEYSVGQIIECMRYCGFDNLKVLSKRLSTETMKTKILKNILIFLSKNLITPAQWEDTIFLLFKKKK